MKQSIKKLAFVWFAIALLVGNIHTNGQKAAAALATIPDGEYEIDFNYLYDGRDTVSTAEQYLKLTNQKGKLIIQGEQAVFEHTVTATNAGYFPYLGYRLPESPKAVIVSEGSEEPVSEADLAGYTAFNMTAIDPATDTVTLTYQFAVDRLDEKHDVLMHVVTLAGAYDHWYNVQLKLDLSGLQQDNGNEGSEPGEEEPQAPQKSKEEFQSLLSTAEQLLVEAEEGSEYGQYVAGSKDILNSAIQNAMSESAVLAEDDKDAYGRLYETLNTALHSFQNQRKLADRSEITKLIETVNSFLNGVKAAGTTEGTPGGGGTTTATVVGEYDHSQVSNLKNFIAATQKIIDNPETTDDQIQSRINALNNNYNLLLDSEFVYAEPFDIYVLDTREYTTEQSVYANEIEPVAETIVQKQYANTYHSFYANLTFNITDVADDLVYSSYATESDNDFMILEPNPYFTIKAPLVSSLSTGEQKVYQHLYPFYYQDIQESDWKGLAYISYSRKSDTQERKLYISFNAEQLKQLQQAVAQAERLLEKSEKVDDASEEAANKFQAAIEEVKKVSSNLAATRPEIKAAADSLAAAAAQYKKYAVYDEYFTVVNGTEDIISRADSYLEKPARITPDAEGQVTVSLNLNNSSAIREFKVKVNEDYEDVEVISTDEAENTRSVAFTLPELSQWVEAQVRVVTTVEGTEYDNTYPVRLFFNGVDNAQLSAKILEATAFYNSAVVGTNAGQYPQEAKDQLAEAIEKANQAVTVQGANQQLSDEQTDKLTQAIEQFKAAAIPTNGNNPGTGPAYPADGHYYINFRILKDGTDSNSMAYDYVVSPALVKVQGGQRTVMFTVKQSAEIRAFTLEGQNEQLVSQSTQNNTRVISFTLSSLAQKMSGTVRVDWDAFNYHHTYTIQFLFDEATAVAVTDANPKVPGSEDSGQVGVDDDKLNEYNNGNTPAEEEEQEEEGAANETEGNAEEEESSIEAPSITFSDVENHWARASIEKAVKLGIVNGFSDGSFRPNGTVTRAEFAVMISRALKLEGNADGSSFKDYSSIPGWAQAHVARVADAGLISGYSDETFRANTQLTRAELAVIIARAAKLELDSAAALDFSDAAQIPGWSQKEVSAAVKAGLILGKEKDRFDPNGTATRAEALTLIIRLLEL